MTYMFFLIHLETCGYFSISAHVGLGTDEWVYEGTGTASVSLLLSLSLSPCVCVSSFHTNFNNLLSVVVVCTSVLCA